MPTKDSIVIIPALKDGASQQPIPSLWRPVFREVLIAFAKGDYLIKEGILGVETISPELAAAIEWNMASYGAKLIELSEETWGSSVCMWYGGYWDALVDLWTLEEGPSDLILSSRVIEGNSGPSFAVTGVYVP